MLEVQGVRKRFGAITAVAGVSFVAPDGRITGLLGPNGAGKSTTLRVISGALRPDDGRALVDGIDVGVDPVAARRRLGVLPDQRGLYPRLTARENIAYFAALHGMSRDAQEAGLASLRDLLGLAPLLDRRVAGFSTGERLRVALARALVHRPSTLILDEPTSGLDVPATRSLRDLLRDLRAAGRCVVFSSHIMPEVAALCDEVTIIARGAVVASGTPEGLRARTGAASLEDAYLALTDPDAAEAHRP